VKLLTVTSMLKPIMTKLCGAQITELTNYGTQKRVGYEVQPTSDHEGVKRCLGGARVNQPP
jgi:hypothetical protein